MPSGRSPHPVELPTVLTHGVDAATPTAVHNTRQLAAETTDDTGAPVRWVGAIAIRSNDNKRRERKRHHRRGITDAHVVVKNA